MCGAHAPEPCCCCCALVCSACGAGASCPVVPLRTADDGADEDGDEFDTTPPCPSTAATTELLLERNGDCKNPIFWRVTVVFASRWSAPLIAVVVSGPLAGETLSCGVRELGDAVVGEAEGREACEL